MRKKILIVFGTRPEAIKMVPVVKAFQEEESIFETKVCVTAQHREMLDQVLEVFQVKPDYDLDIMKPGQDLYDITSKVLLSIRDVLAEFEPDLVLVHGDTTTSTVTALSCFYKRIPVGHVEAGLRTGNIYSPWPEELNRKITGTITTMHFSPTEMARANLIKENVSDSTITITGNTVIDALFMASDKIKASSELETEILEGLRPHFKCDLNSILSSNFILITGHRRENFGDGFISICKAIKETALKYQDYHLIYPVHLNPNVQKPVYELLENIENVHLIPPLSYLPFIYLMEKCQIVLTDSGGIQEEAPSFGKPVLVMRDTTERPEAIEAGTVKLVGVDKNIITKELSLLIEDDNYYQKMSKAHNPYGDGKASGRIVEFVKNNLK